MKSMKILLLIMVLVLPVLAACSNSTAPIGSTIQPTPEELAEVFSASVKYDNEKGMLSFTIPKEIPAEYSFYIHVSGRVKMGEDAMSIHLFEEESDSNGWEAGKTYNHEFEKGSLVEALIISGVQVNESTEILYETGISIDESGSINMISN